MSPHSDPHAPNLAAYDTWMRGRNASASTRAQRVKFARRALLMWPDLGAVTERQVVDYLGRPELTSAWSRAAYMNHLRSLFAWAIDHELADVDPTARLVRPRSPRQQPRPLTLLEVRRAQAAAGPDVAAMLALGLLAGLRAHEAAKINSDDVTETGLYVRGKGGHEAILPTHPTLWVIAQTRGPGYWFPGQGGRPHIGSATLSMKVTKVFEPLGIVGSFHRCRHYFGTSLLRSGVNIRVVQELMRHASLATTAAYLGVDESEKSAAVLGLVA